MNSVVKTVRHNVGDALFGVVAKHSQCWYTWSEVGHPVVIEVSWQVKRLIAVQLAEEIEETR